MSVVLAAMILNPGADPTHIASAKIRFELRAWFATSRVCSFVKWFRRICCWLAIGLVGLNLSAAEAAKKPFDIPAGTAPGTLKQFSAQAGGHLLYSAEAVEGVKTNAVRGAFTAREVIDRMLNGTGLAVKEDEKTGALAITPAESGNGQDHPAEPREDAQSSTKKKTR